VSEPLTDSAGPGATPGQRIWSPWRVVVGFGTISLAADMVYEGGRSLYGPLLSSLGASALAVGAITGAGEAVALLLRLASGTLADRTRRYWAVTIAGYALTAICVPLLAVTPYLGAAGLAVATVLILAERTGKAVRSPAKSALLAGAAQHVGMGRGLGVHKALDQIGAFAGPLLVAGVVALAGAVLWPGFAVLAVPGAVAMVLLVMTRHRMPAEEAVARSPAPSLLGGLPAAFWQFAAASAVCTAGLVTFGLVGFHLVAARIVPTAGVPLLYAAAMAAGAVAALLTGEAYDRVGARTLLALPVLVAAVPPLAFAGGLVAVTAGVLLWGAAVGLQDSTVKALVADLVRPDRRATAYGLFAAVQGAGALVGGIATGALYEHSTASLVIAVVASQVLAGVLLLVSAGWPRPTRAEAPTGPG
jgi:Major Facilitator Superfamily